MDDPGPGNFITQYLTLAASGDHTSAGSLVLKLILLLVLILVNAFFAMSEIAIISLNDAKIERMAEDGHKKAKQLVKLTKNSNRFLSTIQIGVTLAGFLTSASAATNFADMLTTAVTNAWDVPYTVVTHISVILITIIISYITLE